jgi:hypothetical protein
VALGHVADIDSLATACCRSVAATEQALVDIERWGLGAVAGEARQGKVSYAGEQFLTRQGRVSIETLDFLAGSPVNDLHTREAIRQASTRLLGEFGDACATGALVDYARALVPPAFQAAVDPDLASRLYACASALIVRLARGEPAGCVAEEIIAVRLIEYARNVLAAWEDALDEESAAHASNELTGIFELFQADDVLALFELANRQRETGTGGSKLGSSRSAAPSPRATSRSSNASGGRDWARASATSENWEASLRNPHARTNPPSRVASARLGAFAARGERRLATRISQGWGNGAGESPPSRSNVACTS